jgi:hypothetical protein
MFHSHQGIPSVDQVFANPHLISNAELRELQDAHNVNLHADEVGSDPFGDHDDADGLSECDEIEFYERYCD